MGDVHVLPDFHSIPEGFTRTVRVYLPDAYDREPSRAFPVVYMHDGQNVFAHPSSGRWDTWCANTTLEGLVSVGAVEPWIIVGIDHGHSRFEEYSPWDEHRLGIAGRGEAYVSFIVDHLKPFIDRMLRTRRGPEWTAIVGASLGGLVSLYAGWTRPEIFGRVGGVSPTVMWSEGRLFHEWKQHTGRWSRVHLDVGGREFIWRDHVPLDYPAAVPAFHQQLRRAGYGDHELRLVWDELGEHHESAWQRRLPDTFAWLLGGW